MLILIVSQDSLKVIIIEERVVIIGEMINRNNSRMLPLIIIRRDGDSHNNRKISQLIIVGGVLIKMIIMYRKIPISPLPIMTKMINGIIIMIVEGKIMAEEDLEEVMTHISRIM